jgi:hypothetical protein
MPWRLFLVTNRTLQKGCIREKLTLQNSLGKDGEINTCYPCKTVLSYPPPQKKTSREAFVDLNQI